MKRYLLIFWLIISIYLAFYITRGFNDKEPIVIFIAFIGLPLVIYIFLYTVIEPLFSKTKFPIENIMNLFLSFLFILGLFGIMASLLCISYFVFYDSKNSSLFINSGILLVISSIITYYSKNLQRDTTLLEVTKILGFKKNTDTNFLTYDVKGVINGFDIYINMEESYDNKKEKFYYSLYILIIAPSIIDTLVIEPLPTLNLSINRTSDIDIWLNHGFSIKTSNKQKFIEKLSTIDPKIFNFPGFEFYSLEIKNGRVEVLMSITEKFQESVKRKLNNSLGNILISLTNFLKKIN